MNIKFLDLKAQYDAIKREIDPALSELINSGSFVLGKAVSRFENDFAEYCGCRYAIGVDSGTSALLLALKALGIGPGDEVITAANTFIATVAAIIHTGATPVLVDIDPDTRNIDLNLIEKHLTPRTRAIIPVHLYGSMVDMNRLAPLADKHHLLVLEDAAQAHGARFHGKPAGSFGMAAGFSFYPAKNLGAYGEAGAVVTSDAGLADEIKMLRDHGSMKKYFHEKIGFNARMDGLQGAILAVKLKYLDKWNTERNRVAERYRNNLKDLPLVPPMSFDDSYQVYHQFVIEVDQRDKFQKFLLDKGIPTMIHYPVPIHMQNAFIDSGFHSGSYPVTEKLAGRIVSLPIYPELSNEEIDYISRYIHEFFTGKSNQ